MKIFYINSDLGSDDSKWQILVNPKTLKSEMSSQTWQIENCKLQIENYTWYFFYNPWLMIFTIFQCLTVHFQKSEEESIMFSTLCLNNHLDTTTFKVERIHQFKIQKTENNKNGRWLFHEMKKILKLQVRLYFQKWSFF